MKLRIKAEFIGGFIVREQHSFLMSEATVTLYTLSDKNYIEVTKDVKDYQPILAKGLYEILDYTHKQKEGLLSVLRKIESIGSFVIHIQEIKYNEMEFDWIPENDNDKTNIEKLLKTKCSTEKDNSLIEVSQERLESIANLSEKLLDDIYVFELFRQGGFSFRNDRFYFAFINFFMILEEAFGKGKFQTKQLEANFTDSKVLRCCVLSAIELLSRNPLEALYVEWMQEEVKRRFQEWTFEAIVKFLVKFRGEYFHSPKRVEKIEQRDQFYKHIAAFTQTICFVYCCYLIESFNKSVEDMENHIDSEIDRLTKLAKLSN